MTTGRYEAVYGQSPGHHLTFSSDVLASVKQWMMDRIGERDPMFAHIIDTQTEETVFEETNEEPLFEDE